MSIDLTNDNLSLESLDCKLRHNIVRCAIVSGFCPGCTCLQGVGGPVHLNPTHILRVCGPALGRRPRGLWVFGRGRARLPICRRWHVVLFFWVVLFLLMCEVPDEYGTENEDNEANHSPTNDFPER